MNILLVTDSYPPEIRSASHLMQELAEGLRDRGHKVTVITSDPQYNLTDEFRNKVFGEFSTENGINVIRVKTLPHHKVNLIVRGLAQITMPYIFYSKVNKYLKDKVDVVIVYSPPLPLAIVGNMIKNKYGSKFILNIQDIFPQNVIDLGIIKNYILIKFFEWLERRAYKGADKIMVHSEGNEKFLIQKKQVPHNKVYALHNWIDIKPHIQANGTGSFRKKFGLQGKFVFLFAGVIGPSQNLDLVVNIAKGVKKIPDIVFLLVGDGMEKDRLVRMVEDNKLTNVIFKPFVSKEEYPELVKDADVGIVCLSSKNKTPVVPGKILGYMAASIPIVAFLHKESDGHSLIKEAGCGFTAVSDNEEKVLETILKIYNERDKLGQYGKNGFKYVSNNFDKNVCIDKLERLF